MHYYAKRYVSMVFLQQLEYCKHLSHHLISMALKINSQKTDNWKVEKQLRLVNLSIAV